MKLTFLGTRGEIEERTPLHGRHTSLLVAYRGGRVRIDCGEDWSDDVAAGSPQAIVLTHAHPDHAWGLKNGAPCPVYATAETWRLIEAYPLEERRVIEPRIPLEIRGITFEAFPVEHSIRCPAVAYRIAAGNASVVYAPDVVYINDRSEALAGIDVYIGDGATIEQSFVRRSGGRLLGHAPVRTQLTWCQKEGVARAVITHCGSEIVRDHDAAEHRIAEFARKRGVAAELARDGMEMTLR
ncbi:MAG: MBL fold metallo-hydrolase [Planctomycetes bacterium]|nr:MBL fold metallo-hydrolase [Planctomycetota bacterium]